MSRCTGFATHAPIARMNARCEAHLICNLRQQCLERHSFRSCECGAHQPIVLVGNLSYREQSLLSFCRQGEGVEPPVCGMNFTHQQATRLEVVYQRDESTGVHVERGSKGLLAYSFRPTLAIVLV